jgi:hypothetical protein
VWQGDGDASLYFLQQKPQQGVASVTASCRTPLTPALPQRFTPCGPASFVYYTRSCRFSKSSWCAEFDAPGSDFFAGFRTTEKQLFDPEKRD